MVSTIMRSNSVYSKEDHWEEQGLNLGFIFFLCLRENQVFFCSPFFFFCGSAQVGPRSNVPIGTNRHVQRGAKLSKKKIRKKKQRKGCNGRGPIPTCEEHVGKNKVWNV